VLLVLLLLNEVDIHSNYLNGRLYVRWEGFRAAGPFDWLRFAFDA
jgi:hypothetical protein